MANVKARAAYKGQLTQVLGVIAQYKNEAEQKKHGARIHLERQLEICDKIRLRYNKVQDEIVNKAETDEEREREIEDQNAFLNDIEKAESDLNDLIVLVMIHDHSLQVQLESTRVEEDKFEKLLKGMTEAIGKINAKSSGNYSQLDSVKLPTFSGSYAKWHSYKALFVSLVHNNPNFSDVDKLHHLFTSLSDSAKMVVEHLDLTDENYSVAWTALCNRYEQRRQVVKELIQGVKKLPFLKYPIHVELEKIYDVATTTLKAMDKIFASGRDAWVIEEILAHLDPETQTMWAREQSDMPTWDDFAEFLAKRCRDLSTCPSIYTPELVSSKSNYSQKSKGDNYSKNNVKSNKNVKSLTISNEKPSQDLCTLCKKSPHKIWKCGKFKSMPALKRLETVNNLNLCVNCISESRSNHTVDNCPYPPCKHCGKLHNYWVHDALTQTPSELTPVTSQASFSGPSTSSATPKTLNSVLPSVNEKSGEVQRAILKTVCVKVLDSESNVHVCRALLDFGSEISVMTTNLSQRLRLKLHKSPYTQVEGFQGQVTQLQHQVNAILISKQGVEMLVQCQVSPKISSNLPTCHIKRDDVEIPEKFDLADPAWYRARRIDMLIGAAHEDDIMLDEVHKLGEGIPSLRNTIFGWVVGGKWTPENTNPITRPVCHKLSWKTELQEDMQKFWELEELSEENPQSVEHKEVEAFYESTTTRSETGQYIVQLPLKENFGELGSNRRRASRQLTFLEKRLSKSPQLYREYSNIFEEYLSLGIIEIVPPEELESKSYYMTHHCVVRENASSTKVRIVFNCASVSETGLSLNDVVKVGPVLQPELIEILWRFRLNEIALSCDIVKMYLQILLALKHRDFQRFLWRLSPKGKIIVLRFKTLCFGNAVSPYLAIKSTIRLSEDEGEKYPRAAKALRNNFYVDDCLLSVKSVKEAIEVQQELPESLTAT